MSDYPLEKLSPGYAYAIRDWDNIFEISQSKRVSHGRPLTWVAMPTKHDGKGLRRILRADSENSPSMYGAWCLIVQLSAKMPRRGVFADEDGALNAEDIADSIGISPSYVERTLAFCLSPAMKWIELILLQESECAPSALLAAPSAIDGSMPTGQYRTEQNSTRELPPTPSGGDGVKVLKSKSKKCKAADLDAEAYPNFLTWWKAYPNKKNKQQALKSWHGADLESIDQEPLLRILNLQKRQSEWTKDNGQYVPHPSTYLNQARYMDDPAEIQKQSGPSDYKSKLSPEVRAKMESMS